MNNVTDAKDETKAARVFDVAKSSIVTSRPVLSDPKAAQDKTEELSSETPQSLSPSLGKLKIAPISDPQDLRPVTKKSAIVEVESPSDAVESDESSIEQDQLKDINPDSQDLADHKAAERQANLDKVALAKTYYLPINQVVKRRSRHVAAAGVVLIIILGLVWLDMSLDAGLISLPGIEAPTHFFSK